MEEGLFPLRLTRRVELRGREHRYLPDLPPLVLQKGEKVALLDIFTIGFFCETRHGKAILPADCLKPFRQRQSATDAPAGKRKRHEDGEKEEQAP